MSTPTPDKELRVQQSGVTGHRSDTDDVVGGVEIYEALVNPHDGSGGQSGQRGGAGGSPMMMPPGMMGNLIKGIDMVALIVGPMLLGAPTWVSLGIGLVALLVLRGGFDQEELKALQEEQRRQMAESSAKPEKRQIPPPRRRS